MADNFGSTEVISLRMADLRKKYGKTRYANQIEWAEDPNHVPIGRANTLRVKTDQGYIPFPSKSPPFANPYPAKKHGR